MRFAVLGSGIVRRTLAGKLSAIGHDVAIGTRDVDALLARRADVMGNEPFGPWKERNPQVQLGSFSEVAARAEIVLNATAGAGSLEALGLAGPENLRGKILIDVANPLDSSRGMPPSLLVSNTDSLAEQIQRSFPEAKVVKTLNTVNALVMVDPGQIAGGEHHVFVSGDDGQAKDQVTEILRSFGWKHVIDLGGIGTARGAEMYLPLWVTLMDTLRSPTFNIRIVQAGG